MKLNPADTDALFELYQCQRALKQHIPAIDTLTKLIAHDPEDDTLYVIRGANYISIYFKRGDKMYYTKAIHDFTKAISINPNNSEAYGLRGVSSVRFMLETEKHISRDKPKALYSQLQDFNAAIKLNSSNAEYYVQRGLVKGFLERIDGAIEDLEKALELEPQNQRALDGLKFMRTHPNI
ncbi:MAG: tetratricopeptide repeat protein [Vampirovibrionales bacterium]